MAPPELARDAPRLDVLHPGEIGVLVLLRHELGAALADRRDRRLGQHLGVHPPLVGQVRLDDDELRLLVVRHHDLLVLDVIEDAERLESASDLLARLEAVEAAILLAARCR